MVIKNGYKDGCEKFVFYSCFCSCWHFITIFVVVGSTNLQLSPFFEIWLYPQLPF